jgi:hypothetical protein
MNLLWTRRGAGRLGLGRGRATLSVALTPAKALVVAAGAALAGASVGMVGAMPPPIPLEKLPALPAGYKAPDNAALLYLRAWETSDRELVAEVAGWVSEGGAAWTPTEEQIEKMANLGAFVRDVTRASMMPGAEWNTEYNLGWYALLPHLGGLRRSAHVLDADARRLVMQGDLDGAASRYATVVRVAAHAKTDGLLISTLVSQAILRGAAEKIVAMQGAGKLTPAGAREIATALERLSGDDPFDAKGAIRLERWAVVDYTKAAFTGPDAGAAFVRSMRALQGDEAVVDVALGAMDGAALAREADRAAPLYEKALEAWGAPDAEARLAALERAVEAGEYGPVAKLLTPAFTRAHRAETAARASLAEARAAVAKVAGGR